MDTTQTVRLAVITGSHSFDVIGFHHLFAALAPEITGYIQHMDDYAAARPEDRAVYDAVLFFSMVRDEPHDEGLAWYQGKPRTALEDLGNGAQGIVVLHHGLLSHPGWGLWGEITGQADRSFTYHPEQQVTARLPDTKHSITRGLASWTMTDETYGMVEPVDSDVLITYDHPLSLRSIAWTRRYRQARVFYAAGHDDRAWSHPGFREVLRRGILWSACRL
jgi:uncharacterized protein